MSGVKLLTQTNYGLVTDFHRTWLKGGVFLYSPTESNPDGKLGLLYEANQIAFLAEQVGAWRLTASVASWTFSR